jgi:hypothetical protein
MKFIFNSSLPRSGSELLQCVISQRDDVFSSTTSPLLEYIYAASQNLATQEAQSLKPDERMKSFFSFCKSGMEGYANSFTEKNIFCDKSRGWIFYYKLAENILGEPPKMICMVRDLRQIVASMESLHRRNIADGLVPDNELITTEERVKNWLTTEPIGRAVRRLKNAIDSEYNVLYIRYEDFCSDPVSSMEKVETYLDIPKFTYDFTNIKKINDENESAFGYNGVHTIKKTIEKPANRADEILGLGLSNEIHSLNLWYQNLFEYK